MGASVNTAVNNSTQTSVNNAFQTASSICNVDCREDVDNVNITANASSIGGVTISQVCTPEALCTMRTSLDAISDQQLQAQQNAQATAAGGGGILGSGVFAWAVNTTVNNTNQTLENSTTQVINNVCNASAEEYISNVNITATNGGTIGQVLLSQAASPKAACAISATASARSSQKETSDQVAISKTVDSILATIIGLAILGLIGTILASGGKKDPTDADATTSGTEMKSGTTSKAPSLTNQAIIAGATMRGGPGAGAVAASVL